MAEYITKEQAYNSVDERLKELEADKEFNIFKKICVDGVKRHIATIPPTDVVERSKIDKAIEQIEQFQSNLQPIKHTEDYENIINEGKDLACDYILKILRNIGE